MHILRCMIYSCGVIWLKLPELLDKIRYADAADIGKLLIADFIF